MRYTTEEERKENSGDKVKVLIETRGEGGYVLAPPSAGYEVVNDVEIPLITTDEREILLSICISFNETEEITVGEATCSNNGKYILTPYQDYNEHGDVCSLLQKHQWTIVRIEGERTYFCRPGKSGHISADYHAGLRRFKTFTTSTIFEAGKG